MTDTKRDWADQQAFKIVTENAKKTKSIWNRKFTEAIVAAVLRVERDRAQNLAMELSKRFVDRLKAVRLEALREARSVDLKFDHADRFTDEVSQTAFYGAVELYQTAIQKLIDELDPEKVPELLTEEDRTGP